MKSLQLVGLAFATALFTVRGVAQVVTPIQPQQVQRVASVRPEKPAPDALPHNYQVSVTVTEPGKPTAELSVVLAQPDTAFKVDLQELQDEKGEAPPGSVLFSGTMRVDADGKVFVNYAIAREFAVVAGTRGDAANLEARQRSYQFKVSTLQGSARVTPGVPLNIGKSGARIYTLSVTQLPDRAVDKAQIEKPKER